MRIALVLWNGTVGGAETLSVELARVLREGGEVQPTVVFVGAPGSLAERLDTARLAYESIGWPRGRSVLVHPRQFARFVATAGSDGALLIECGFIAAALRAGGY